MSESTKASLLANGSGAFKVQGRLDFDSVPPLLRDAERAFAAETDLDIDFADVSHSNSAGLGLILEWMRLAGQRNCKIRFRHIPSGILAVARASDLEDLLPSAD